MGWLILFLFVGIPLIELSVLIEVGSDIGALATIALCLLTAGIGLSLIRMQGLKVISDLQSASSRGEPIVEPVMHGFFLLIAGALLFFPGFVTDAIGGLLLIPPVRLALGKAGLAGAAAKHTGNFRYPQRHEQSNTTIIDGEFTNMDTGADEGPRPENPWAKRVESDANNDNMDG